MAVPSLSRFEQSKMSFHKVCLISGLVFTVNIYDTCSWGEGSQVVVQHVVSIFIFCAGNYYSGLWLEMNNSFICLHIGREDFLQVHKLNYVNCMLYIDYP